MSEESRAIEENVTLFLQRENIKLVYEFIPFSQSQSKSEKNKSLNYDVTVLKNGRDILTTPYWMGVAHCPAYKSAVGLKTSIYNTANIEWECEYGRRRDSSTGEKPILPSATDVLYSLVLDSEVLDAGGFEAWASNHGYDVDSRKAEATYHACLEIALKLNAGLGAAALAELRQLLEGY